jgi:hypothetical protein
MHLPKHLETDRKNHHCDENHQQKEKLAEASPESIDPTERLLRRRVRVSHFVFGVATSQGFVASHRWRAEPEHGK